MNVARAELLERCLRLEARLLGVEIADLSEPAPLPELRELRAPCTVRRKQRKVTPEKAFVMGELRAKGLSYTAIATRTGFAAATVRVHVLGVG